MKKEKKSLSTTKIASESRTDYNRRIVKNKVNDVHDSETDWHMIGSTPYEYDELSNGTSSIEVTKGRRPKRK